MSFLSNMVPKALRNQLPFICWPKGLSWYETSRYNYFERRSKRVKTYTIRSKGRTGARNRLYLMTQPRFKLQVK